MLVWCLLFWLLVLLLALLVDVFVWWFMFCCFLVLAYVLIDWLSVSCGLIWSLGCFVLDLVHWCGCLHFVLFWYLVCFACFVLGNSSSCS